MVYDNVRPFIAFALLPAVDTNDGKFCCAKVLIVIDTKNNMVNKYFIVEWYILFSYKALVNLNLCLPIILSK